MQKVCVVCTSSFETKYSRLTVCSNTCRTENGRRKSREWAAQNLDKVAKSNRETQKRRLENGKFRGYQELRRSSKAGYLDRFLERARTVHPSTDLTRAYLESIFGSVCAVTGVPFSFDRKKGTGFQNPYAPSIDRIDSSKPYEVGNIQIVLTAVNFAKSEMTMENFTKVWRDITKSWAALTRGEF